MCYVFAGQDPETYSFQTRSVRLGGHCTSIRLEAKFWEVLEEIAAAQNLTIPRFLSQLYDEALEINGEVRNFASLLRCSCLVYLTGAAAAVVPQPPQPAADRVPA